MECSPQQSGDSQNVMQVIRYVIRDLRDQNHKSLTCNNSKIKAIFVCLSIWSFSSPLRIFHSYGAVTIASESLQILTYARHSWPLSSEGSLTYHTCCNMGLPFIMVISEDPYTRCRAFGTTYFYDLGLLRPGIKPRSPG